MLSVAYCIHSIEPGKPAEAENKKIEVIDWSALGLIKALRAGQQNIDSEKLHCNLWDWNDFLIIFCIPTLPNILRKASLQSMESE